MNLFRIHVNSAFALFASLNVVIVWRCFSISWILHDFGTVDWRLFGRLGRAILYLSQISMSVFTHLFLRSVSRSLMPRLSPLISLVRLLARWLNQDIIPFGLLSGKVSIAFLTSIRPFEDMYHFCLRNSANLGSSLYCLCHSFQLVCCRIVDFLASYSPNFLHKNSATLVFQLIILLLHHLFSQYAQITHQVSSLKENT